MFKPFAFFNKTIAQIISATFKLVASKSTNYSGAIDADNGKAYQWGLNSSFVRGDNKDNLPVETSFPAPFASNFVAGDLSQGGTSVVAIQKSTGNAYAWGTGGSGQLGNNTINTESSPISVFGGRSFSKVASYLSHITAIEASTGNI